MVFNASRVRRLSDPVISSNLTVQTEYEQIAIENPVTYRTVMKVASVLPNVADVRAVCEQSRLGYDPVAIAGVVATFRPGAQELLDRLNE